MEEIGDHALFGKIVLRWGYVENTLVGIVMRLTHPRFGLMDHHGVPMSFGGRIRLAKRGYREIAAMTLLYDEAKQILDSLWPLSETRNVIVHGYYQGFTGSDRYMFGFYETREGRKRTLKSYEFSAAELSKLTEDIEGSRTKLEDLSAKTFEIHFPRIERKTMRKQGS